jgi:hypothetical protein
MCLLSNALKFSYEGSIMVRCVVVNPSQASNDSEEGLTFSHGKAPP